MKIGTKSFNIRSLMSMIEIMAHPTSDCNAAAITVQTKKGAKYVIVQCGEGLQRSMSQNRNRMGKLANVFLTGTTNWKTIGGLPGFLLTVTEQGAKSLKLQSAGNNLAWGCNSWRNFMFHNMLDLKIEQPDKIFKDDYLAIAPVLLEPTYAHSIPGRVKQSLENDLNQQPDTVRDERSSCFIVQILPSRGKFLVQAARNLGVKPGAGFGKLANGVSITTDSGNVVTPDMVMEAPKIPPRVLVIDIPTPYHVDAAINNDWKKDITKDTKVDVRVVYHFLGENVEIDKKYQHFIQSFGDDVLHYILHPKYCPNSIALRSAEWLNINDSIYLIILQNCITQKRPKC